jgi:hypothetical protein
LLSLKFFLEGRKTQSFTENSAPLFGGKFKKLVSLGLALSGTLGFCVLETDRLLWSLGRANAYGLLVISVLDFALAVLLTFVPGLATPVIGSAILMTILQVGDLLSAPRHRLAVSYFTAYAFALIAFAAFLITQFAIGIASYMATRNIQNVLPTEEEEKDVE